VPLAKVLLVAPLLALLPALLVPALGLTSPVE
jgi:hypothetical protein